MISKKLIKGIVCGLMLTTVIGSAVYAGTGSGSVVAYKKNVNKSYFGAAGTYVTSGTSDYFMLKASSSSSSNKLYKVEVCRTHINSGALGDLDADAAILKAPGKVDALIMRTWDDVFSKYTSTATTYNSASEITGIQDNYVYTVMQADL